MAAKEISLFVCVSVCVCLREYVPMSVTVYAHGHFHASTYVQTNLCTVPVELCFGVCVCVYVCGNWCKRQWNVSTLIIFHIPSRCHNRVKTPPQESRQRGGSAIKTLLNCGWKQMFGDCEYYNGSWRNEGPVITKCFCDKNKARAKQHAYANRFVMNMSYV